ncbi:type II secretion system protein [Paraburkholderia heleia]|uniref:type II secretion system protein n=1 Tax=Paraburkholderia heleia TaxID=634127 RepID=UPI002AB76870|nr:hypothetical protein [Paraburkholderia heleia]
MRRYRQQGFSLLEAALAVMLLGIILVLYMGLTRTASQNSVNASAQQLTGRIKDSVIAFAALNGRVPCPAADQSGVEMATCGQGASGRVPYATLGLPAYVAASVTYTTPAYVSAHGASFNLTRTRLPNVLQVDGTQLQPAGSIQPVPGPSPDGRSYALAGLCEALLDPSGSASTVYSLSGNAGTAGAATSSGESLYARELSARLACASMYSASARSYFNVLAAFNATYRNFADYLSIITIEFDEAGYDLENNIQAIVYEAVKVSVKLAQAYQAQGACDEDPAKCTQAAIAWANYGIEGSYEVNNAAKLVRYTINLINATSNYTTMQQLVNSIYCPPGQTGCASGQPSGYLVNVSIRAQDSVALGNFMP